MKPIAIELKRNLELFTMGFIKERSKAQMEYEIINVRGHYEAYLNGKFICSGDSIKEVIKELAKEM